MLRSVRLVLDLFALGHKGSAVSSCDDIDVQFVEKILEEGTRSPRTIRLATLHLTGLWLSYPSVIKYYMKELKLLTPYGSGLVSRSVYTSAKSSYVTGMTATIAKEPETVEFCIEVLRLQNTLQSDGVSLSGFIVHQGLMRRSEAAVGDFLITAHIVGSYSRRQSGLTKRVLIHHFMHQCRQYDWSRIHEVNQTLKKTNTAKQTQNLEGWLQD